jgi:hypothetical protein
MPLGLFRERYRELAGLGITEVPPFVTSHEQESSEGPEPVAARGAVRGAGCRRNAQLYARSPRLARCDATHSHSRLLLSSDATPHWILGMQESH